jgi:hypothetical protein
MPGTPAEPNLDFSNDYMAAFGMSGMGMNGMGMNGMGGMPMQGNQMMPDDFDFGSIGFGLAGNMNDMTIDEPAKRLFSKAGSMNPQQIAYALKSGQLNMDGELQKKLREQQLVGGLGGPVIGLNNFPDQENKPFKCPVIGCEKAYKNQNGLKYHKQVSDDHMQRPISVTCATPFFCQKLITNSTATTTKSSKTMETARSRLWIPSHLFRILAPLAWRRRSLINAPCAASDTRI